MLPGPVPMPERVRQAMMRQAINHRSAAFGEVYADCMRVLKTVSGTANDLFVISGSGTAAMEAAVANFGRGRRIVSLVNGKFGDRLRRIGDRYGSVTPIEPGWGMPFDLSDVGTALEAGAEVVTMVHNETSAGIRNPARELGKLAQEHGALFIMDGITSIGGDVVEADRWGVDVAIVGSQKCLAAPAGLSAISVSGKAWDMLAEARPFYLDLGAYRKSAAKSPPETPYTPAVPLFFALREALLIVEEEGVLPRAARHEQMAQAVRSAAKAWGLDLFPVIDDIHAYSNTVTAIRLPAGISDAEFRGGVRDLGVVIAGGQDHLRGRIFRIGTMGAVGAPEILATLAAVERVLRRYGVPVAGDGVQAAAEVME